MASVVHLEDKKYAIWQAQNAKYQAEADDEARARREKWAGVLIGFGPLLVMLLLGGWHYKRVALGTVWFGDWLRDKGHLGMLIYLLVFTVYLVICGPSTPFEMLGGFVYPMAWALLLNTAAKLVGSVSTYQSCHFTQQ